MGMPRLLASIIVLVLLIASDSSSAAPADAGLTWTEFNTGIVAVNQARMSTSDGQTAYFSFRESGAGMRFAEASPNGSLTILGDLSPGGAIAPNHLEFVSGSTFASVFYDSGIYKSAASTDGGVTWSGPTNIVVQASRQETENLGIISPSRYQVYISDLGIYETNNTGATWSATGQECGDSGDGAVPEWMAIIGAYAVSEVQRGKTPPTSSTQILWDCSVPTSLESYNPSTNVNGFHADWIGGHAWLMISQDSTSSAWRVLYSQSADISSPLTLYDSASGDATWQTLDECSAVGSVYFCILAAGATRELVFSLNAGGDWQRSQVTSSLPSGANLASTVAYADGRFYMLAGSTSGTGTYHLYVSDAVEIPVPSLEPAEFSEGLSSALAAIGFVTPGSQLFFVMMLTAILMIGAASGLKWLSSGRMKNGTILGISILVGIFGLIFGWLFTWMFILSTVMGAAAVFGISDMRNTWREVREMEMPAGLGPRFLTRARKPQPEGGVGGPGEAAESPEDAAPTASDQSDDAARFAREVADEVRQGQAEVAAGTSRVRTEAFQRGEDVKDA